MKHLSTARHERHKRYEHFTHTRSTTSISIRSWVARAYGPFPILPCCISLEAAFRKMFKLGIFTV